MQELYELAKECGDGSYDILGTWSTLGEAIDALEDEFNPSTFSVELPDWEFDDHGFSVELRRVAAGGEREVVYSEVMVDEYFEEEGEPGYIRKGVKALERA